MFISLGPNCHGAGNLLRLGLRKESFPFDWLLVESKSTFEYVNKLIDNNFEDFTKDLSYNHRNNVVSKNYDYVEFVHYDLIQNKTIGRKNDTGKNLIDMFKRRAERFMNAITNKNNNIVFTYYLNYKSIVENNQIINNELYQEMINFDTNTNIKCKFKVFVYLANVDSNKLLLPNELTNLKNFIFDKYTLNSSVDKIYGDPKDFRNLLEKNNLLKKKALTKKEIFNKKRNQLLMIIKNKR